MKQFFTILSFLLFANINAQSIADFENFSLPENSYLKDASPEDAFTSGEIRLPNKFTDAGSFTFWEGWVISNIMDTITPGFTNEGASFAGSGFNESAHYAVSYAPIKSVIKLSEQASGTAQISGLYVCNTSYAALSMKEGDGFAKRFGGETGNDPDYFYLSAKKWLNGDLSQDSIIFYLADFRFADNSFDYIIDEWTWLDLSSLGVLDSLQFEMYSSDIGTFGINTPTYFCVDNITIDIVSSVATSVTRSKVSVFPNPSSDYINLSEEQSGEYRIYNYSGQLVLEDSHTNRKIDISSLSQGMYYLLFNSGKKQSYGSFYKQ